MQVTFLYIAFIVVAAHAAVVDIFPRSMPPNSMPPAKSSPIKCRVRHYSKSVNFGPAQKYNAVIFGDYSGSSDVQGRIAIQGNAKFHDGFSVGDQLPKDTKCDDMSVVVKGDLSWRVGQNYYGGIAVGGKCDLKADQLMTKCKVKKCDGDFDFDAAKKAIMDSSKNMGIQKSTTTKKTDVSMKMTIDCKGQYDFEYVDLDDHEFGAKVKEVAPPNGMKQGALLVLNSQCVTCSMKNMSMEGLKETNCLFNFPKATQIDIGGIAVHCGIVAPYANIPAATGVIYGPVYAKSMSGPIQLNWKPPKIPNA